MAEIGTASASRRSAPSLAHRGSTGVAVAHVIDDMTPGPGSSRCRSTSIANKPEKQRPPPLPGGATLRIQTKGFAAVTAGRAPSSANLRAQHA